MKKLLMSALKIAVTKGTESSKTYNHWTFVVQDNCLVEWGTNLMDGIPPKYFGYHSFSGLHSELVAYRRARGLLKTKPYAIINIRLNHRGQMKMAQPCKVCWEWLKATGCNSCWYTTDIGWSKIK